MGDFRVTVDGVGNHGCQRGLKDGAIVAECDDPTCVDCKARRFVKELQNGASIVSAKLEHWPSHQMHHDGTVAPREGKSGPIDDLVSGVRSGDF